MTALCLVALLWASVNCQAIWWAEDAPKAVDFDDRLPPADHQPCLRWQRTFTAIKHDRLIPLFRPRAAGTITEVDTGDRTTFELRTEDKKNIASASGHSWLNNFWLGTEDTKNIASAIQT